MRSGRGFEHGFAAGTGGLVAAAFVIASAGIARADTPPPAPTTEAPSAAPAAPGPTLAAAPATASAPSASPPDPSKATPSEAAEAPSRASEAAASRAWETAPSTRRNGFIAGLTIGLSLGHVTGYPNDTAKIGDPNYRASVGGIGSDLSLFIGGALSDYFNFGFGISAGSTGNGSLTGATSGFVFRTEVFPLFAKGGAWRDIAVLADFGPGAGLMFRGKDRNDEAAKAPSLSLIHAGIQWELQRWAGGHIANGPILLGEYEWANGMQRYAMVAGFRMAFYGGP
jgi:hypothetical protein